MSKVLVALRYVSKEGPTRKEFYGAFDNVQAFIDHTLAVRKHRFFNEYHDSVYTYVLHDSTVQSQKGDDVLDYTFRYGVLRYILNGEVYQFADIPKDFNLSFDNWKALQMRTERGISTGELHPSVGIVIINMLKQIYARGFSKHEK